MDPCVLYVVVTTARVVWSRAVPTISVVRSISDSVRVVLSCIVVSCVLYVVITIPQVLYGV